MDLPQRWQRCEERYAGVGDAVDLIQVHLFE